MIVDKYGEFKLKFQSENASVNMAMYPGIK